MQAILIFGSADPHLCHLDTMLVGPTLIIIARSCYRLVP